MSNGKYPVKKTGSADNERLQINKALDNILDTLSRADQWDEAASWGDHAAENYATAFTELEQFADFGIPSTPTLTKTRETLENGTEVHSITATWPRAGDDSIVYDLEIRECPSGTAFTDPDNTTEVLSKTDLYSVPIISNDSQDTLITYKAFFDANTRYFFRVRIRRNTLVSGWSAFDNIITTRDEDTPPTPASLTATPIADGVRLNWAYDYDANPNVAKIEILRGGVVIDDVPRPSLSYIDEPLTVQSTYTYSIRAVTFFGVQSLNSNSASAVPNRSTVTIRSNSAPNTRPDGSPLQNGDRWIDTDDGERPYVRVGNSWVAEYTNIEGGNVGPGIDGGNITVGTLSVDRIENDIGAVKFSTVLQSVNPPYISGQQGWAIGVKDGFAAAEFDNLNARGNFVAGTNPDERVEISSSGDYRIWVGSGEDTNDANGVFWVKPDGTVKIDKAVFGLGATPNVGSTSGSTTAGVTQTINPVVATFAQFESNGQDVSVSATFDYFARKITSSPTSCPIPNSTTGVLELQRSTDNGSSWTPNIDTASFTIPASAQVLQDPDPSVPDQCIQESAGSAQRTLTDSSPVADGQNVRYRIVMDTWSNFFLSSDNQIITNQISASYTQ